MLLSIPSAWPDLSYGSNYNDNSNPGIRIVVRYHFPKQVLRLYWILHVAERAEWLFSNPENR